MSSSMPLPVVAPTELKREAYRTPPSPTIAPLTMKAMRTRLPTGMPYTAAAARSDPIA